MERRPSRFTSKLSKPKELITSVALGFGGTIEKFPLLSVDVPWLVPFTWTEAPGTASPVVLVTLPVTASCEKTDKKLLRKKMEEKMKPLINSGRVRRAIRLAIIILSV